MLFAPSMSQRLFINVISVSVFQISNNTKNLR